jgi:ABC-type multidrug transport system permease subunit
MAVTTFPVFNLWVSMFVYVCLHDPGLFLWFSVVILIVHPTRVNEKYHWPIKQ